MDKSLYFYPCLVFYPFHLIQGQLTGRNNPGDARLLYQRRAPAPGDGHLGAGMEGKGGKMGSDKSHYPQVLHNHAVQPFFIKRVQKIIHLCQFLFFHKCIYRQINLSPKKMRQADSLTDFLLGKVVRICPGAELCTAQIYGVGACFDGSLQGIKIPRRGKQFHFFHPRSFAFAQKAV